MIILATFTVMLTVSFRTYGRRQAAVATYEKIVTEVNDLGAGRVLPDEMSSLVTPPSDSFETAPASAGIAIQMFLYCVLAIWGGFLSVSSAIRIWLEIRKRVCSDNVVSAKRGIAGSSINDKKGYSKDESLPHPQPAHLAHRQRVVPLTQNLCRQDKVTEISRLVLLLFCGLFLAAGFVFAAREHFTAINYGYQIEGLRREILLRQKQLPQMRLQDLAAPPVTTFQLSAGGSPPYAVLIVFAIVGSVVGVLRYLLLDRIRTRQIRQAPGSTHLGVVDFFYSPHTVEETFKPLIADWRFEYFAALAAQKRNKARWISVRYNYRFALALGLTHLYSVIRALASR